MSVIIEVLKEIKIFFRNNKIKSDFKKKNKHNKAKIGECNGIEHIEIGSMTYGTINAIDFYDGGKLKIGSFCSIAKNVLFVLGGEHYYKTLSTYPFNHFFENKISAFSKGDIIIGDDVWIGVNSIVLSGVTIGKGAVIGAGSVVTKDIPPYSIAAGNPARVIKKRFSDEIIKKIEKVDFSKVDKIFYEKHKGLFCLEISEENVDLIIKEIENETR